MQRAIAVFVVALGCARPPTSHVEPPPPARDVVELAPIARSKFALVPARPTDDGVVILELATPRRIHAIGTSAPRRETMLEQSLGEALEDVEALLGTPPRVVAIPNALRFDGKTWSKLDVDGDVVDAWPDALVTEKVGHRRAIAFGKTLAMPRATKEVPGLAPEFAEDCASLLLRALAVEGTTAYAIANPCVVGEPSAVVKFAPPSYAPVVTKVPHKGDTVLDAIAVDGSTTYVAGREATGGAESPAFVARVTDGTWRDAAKLPIACASIASVAVGRDGSAWVLCERAKSATLLRVREGSVEEHSFEGRRPRALIGDRTHGVYVTYEAGDTVLLSDRKHASIAKL